MIWCTYRLTAAALGLHVNVQAEITEAADEQKNSYTPYPMKEYKLFVDAKNGRTTNNAIIANNVITLHV